MGRGDEITRWTGSQDSWSYKEACSALVIVVVAALIIGIPATRLREEGATRFGWQMFSHFDPHPTFTVIDDEGSSVDIELSDFVPSIRVDLPIEENLPSHLCAQRPEAVEVEIRPADGSLEVFLC